MADFSRTAAHESRAYGRTGGSTELVGSSAMARAEHILDQLRGARVDAETILGRLSLPAVDQEAEKDLVQPGLAGLLLAITSETVRLREVLASIQASVG